MRKYLIYYILIANCALALSACDRQSASTTSEPVGQEAGQEAGQEFVFTDLNADPINRGPAHVGYMSEDITYPPDFEAQDRQIRLALWYPAQEGSGEGEARYPLFTPDQAEFNALPNLNQPAPLLVYSHGAKVWPEMGAFMAEYFASHGWVVLAVAHTGDSLDNVAGDRPDQIYAWRPLDLSAALDHLENLPQAHLLQGVINTQKVLVSGHSFGGYTTFVSAGAQFDLEYLQTTHCQERGGSLCDSLAGSLGTRLDNGFFDSRFAATIPQSAGNYDFLRFGTGLVQIPTLMITATRDQSCTEEGSNQPFWEALTQRDAPLRDQHRRLSFLEAGHATFTVACQHLPALEQDDGCGPDFTPVLEAQKLMLAYSLIFARAYILGDESALQAITMDEGLPARPEWVEWLKSDSL